MLILIKNINIVYPKLYEVVVELRIRAMEKKSIIASDEDIYFSEFFEGNE
jgi:hypothetical protein